MNLRLLKIIFLATTLFGCSQNNESFRENTIQFYSSTEGTRVQETTTENIHSFRVSAIWNKGGDAYDFKFMNKTLVNRVGGNSWEYFPLRYWPTIGTLDFYAYSPGESSGVKSFEVTTTPTYTGAVTIDYDVTTDIQQQEDFLVTGSYDNSFDAHLTFTHVLSHIEFKVEAQEDISLRNITLYNLARQGILTGTKSMILEPVKWEWNGNNERSKRTANYSINMSTPKAITANTTVEIDRLMILPQKYDQGENTNAQNPPDFTERKICIGVTYDYYDITSFSMKTETLYFGEILVPGSNQDEFVMGNKYTFIIQLPQAPHSGTRNTTFKENKKENELNIKVTKSLI